MHNTVDIARLAQLVTTKRGSTNLRDVSAQIKEQGASISPSTLSRLENGHDPDMSTFLFLCDWLNIPASSFFSCDESDPDELIPLSSLGTLADRVGGILYAEPGFDPEAASLVVGLIRKLVSVPMDSEG